MSQLSSQWVRPLSVHRNGHEVQLCFLPYLSQIKKKYTKGANAINFLKVELYEKDIFKIRNCSPLILLSRVPLPERLHIGGHKYILWQRFWRHNGGHFRKTIIHHCNICINPIYLSWARDMKTCRERYLWWTLVPVFNCLNNQVFLTCPNSICHEVPLRQ